MLPVVDFLFDYRLPSCERPSNELFSWIIKLSQLKVL